MNPRRKQTLATTLFIAFVILVLITPEPLKGMLLIVEAIVFGLFAALDWLDARHDRFVAEFEHWSDLRRQRMEDDLRWMQEDLREELERRK